MRRHTMRDTAGARRDVRPHPEAPREAAAASARHGQGTAAGGRAAWTAPALLCAVLASALSPPCAAQELEPRRWAHLPIDTNFIGAAYAYTEAEISDAPAFRLEDVKLDLHTWAAKYIRSFELLGRTARAEVAQAWQQGSWDGLLDGTSASTSRDGWSDTVVRLAVNVVGAPPLEGKEYASYRASRDTVTTVGVALAVHLPTGEYKKDKLINLGSNRFVFRPQIGVVHERGPWSLELTGAAWIYTDNDSFFNGNKLENEPLLTAQGHVVYTFRPGVWAGVGAGYGYGARSTVNGEEKDDRKEVLAWTASFGFPLRRDLGLKLGYIGKRRESKDGTDSDTFSVAVSHFW